MAVYVPLSPSAMKKTIFYTSHSLLGSWGKQYSIISQKNEQMMTPNPAVIIQNIMS